MFWSILTIIFISLFIIINTLGISSVLPKIDGVLDYADEKGNLFYENLSELKKMFIQLPKESSKKDLVNFSEKFNWKRVYEKLEALYDER